jgi:hypothetical protein
VHTALEHARELVDSGAMIMGKNEKINEKILVVNLLGQELINY